MLRLEGAFGTGLLQQYLAGCLPYIGALAGQKKGSDPTAVQHLPQDVMDGLDWPRTTKDPFEGGWEIIFSGALAHPEWSGSDLFQEVQRLFPGRYLPSQQSTLQHGLRKIRAHLLEIMHEPWPHEVIQASLLTPGETQAKQQGREETCPSDRTQRCLTACCWRVDL